MTTEEPVETDEFLSALTTLFETPRVENSIAAQASSVEDAKKEVYQKGPKKGRLSRRTYPVEQERPWAELLKFLKGDSGYDQNLQRIVQQNITERDYGGEINLDTLQWKCMEFVFLRAIETKKDELSIYLNSKKPTMYVNSPIKMMPKVMEELMRLFNWNLISYNYFYVFFKAENSYIKCSKGEILVQFGIGFESMDTVDLAMIPFLDLLRAAKVNALYYQTWQLPGLLQNPIQNMLCCKTIPNRTLPGPLFKPCFTLEHASQKHHPLSEYNAPNVLLNEDHVFGRRSSNCLLFSRLHSDDSLDRMRWAAAHDSGELGLGAAMAVGQPGRWNMEDIPLRWGDG